MSIQLWGLFYAAISLLSGILVLIVDNTVESSPATMRFLKRNDNVFFAWHLACWMTAGMIANYWWDLINADKGITDFSIPKLLLPLLVGPIVFYPTWNLWISSDRKNRIVFIMVAFQNGFFWQAFFQKAQSTVGH